MRLKRNSFVQKLFRGKHTLLGLAMVLTPTLAYAQTPGGTLDRTFGIGGIVTTDFRGSSEGASSVAVQADGKLVAAGASDVNGNGSDFALVRYNSNGGLDTSFGAGGFVTADFGSPWEAATALALQSDGKIVVAGFTVVSFADFALARYNTNGTLDTTFGAGGKVITDFGAVSSQAFAVAVQPDGKIVAAGYANIDGNEDFALVRYNSNGALDTSFGTGGRVTTDFGLVEQGFSWAFG